MRGLLTIAVLAHRSSGAEQQHQECQCKQVLMLPCLHAHPCRAGPATVALRFFASASGKHQLPRTGSFPPSSWRSPDSTIRLLDASVFLPPSSLIENVQMLAGSPMPCRPAYRPCGMEHGLPAYPVPSHSSFRHAFPCSPSPRHGAPLRPPVRPGFHNPLRCVRLDVFACRCSWIYRLSA